MCGGKLSVHGDGHLEAERHEEPRLRALSSKLRRFVAALDHFNRKVAQAVGGAKPGVMIFQLCPQFSYLLDPVFAFDEDAQTLKQHTADDFLSEAQVERMKHIDTDKASMETGH